MHITINFIGTGEFIIIQMLCLYTIGFVLQIAMYIYSL